MKLPGVALGSKIMHFNSFMWVIFVFSQLKHKKKLLRAAKRKASRPITAVRLSSVKYAF